MKIVKILIKKAEIDKNSCHIEGEKGSAKEEICHEEEMKVSSEAEDKEEFEEFTEIKSLEGLELSEKLETIEELVLAESVEIADTFFTRLRGLLGRDALPEGCGLLLSPCSAIHCSGMRFAIDAVFIDKANRVLEIRDGMKPGERAARRGAKKVLELPAGAAAKKLLKVGDLLVVVSDQEQNQEGKDSET